MRGYRFLQKGTEIVFVIAELFLLLRFVLKLFNATTDATFVEWLYATTEPLLGPFVRMFPAPSSEGMVIEFTALFAIIVYAIIGFLLKIALKALNAATREQNARITSQEEKK
ncbi:MAG: YggT family protein [Patescibacteria group bacterium]|jgi:uncharacterized protein YggT (Ycf19 family)